MSEKVILNGGQKVIVPEFPEGLFVRQLPLSKMQEWLESQDNESKLISISIEKDSEWVDANLSTQSQVCILEKAEESNIGFFHSWLLRRIKRTEALAPGSTTEIAKTLGFYSPTGLPKSA